MKKTFLDIWEEEKGLVTIQMAAEILGIKHPSVSRHADNGKFKSFEFGKTRYLSMKDVLFYKAKKDLKKKSL